MIRKFRKPIACGITLFAWVVAIKLELPRPVDACAVSGRSGATVRIADENAIIVWDADAKIQHFIRRASFSADTPDFAFLVPTPTQPTLSESGDQAFSFLETLIVPKIVNEYHFLPPLGCSKPVMTANSAGVRVLEQGQVAGLDYKIFESDTAQNLYDWLKSHDYVAHPSLKAWVEPYVQKHWKFTVFKIAKNVERNSVATSAVRMTFSTEKPFYPYSEPIEESAPYRRRLLRVFFVGENRYSGALGEGRAWPGQTVWAVRLQGEPLASLEGALGMPLKIQAPWLTVFDDGSSSRPGTDDVLFFPSSVQEEFIRTVRVGHDVSGWTCLGICLLVALFPIARLWRRRGA